VSFTANNGFLLSCTTLSSSNCSVTFDPSNIPTIYVAPSFSIPLGSSVTFQATADCLISPSTATLATLFTQLVGGLQTSGLIIPYVIGTNNSTQINGTITANSLLVTTTDPWYFTCPVPTNVIISGNIVSGILSISIVTNTSLSSHRRLLAFDRIRHCCGVPYSIGPSCILYGSF